MKNLPEYLSIQSYINSLLNSGIEYEFKDNFLVIDNFKVKIQNNSTSNIKSYELPIYFNDIPCSVSLFLEETISKFNIDTNSKKTFINKISKSINEIKMSCGNLNSKINSNSFIENEQNHISGHYSHPYPKYKGSNKVVHFIYSPEQKKTFQLQWALVNKSIVETQQSYLDKTNYLLEIEKLEPNIAALEYNREKYYILPFHPHQLFAIEKYINKKTIILLEQYFEENWTSTSSTRTVYNQNSEWMLKFSLTTQITNSVRNLQEEEIKRGILISDILLSNDGQKIKDELKLNNFTIIEEPFFFALKDENNKIDKETICILRKNYFNKQKSENIFQLASLNQHIDHNGKKRINLIIDHIANDNSMSYQNAAGLWFERFLDNAIFPILKAQVKFGLYFGAHQQNIILKLNNEYFPEACYYRDCQGTGIDSKQASKYKNHIHAFENKHENILESSFLNTLFIYYLFINSCYYTIFSIASGDVSLEIRLLHITKLKLIKFLNDHSNHYISSISILLENEVIYTKDNYSCCIKNINENTMQNPLDIYSAIQNPFYIGKNMIIHQLNNQHSFFIENDKINYLKESNFESINYSTHFDTAIYDETNLEKSLNSAITEALFVKNIELQKINSTTREEFFQMNNIWSVSKLTYPQEMTTTYGVNHPLRPIYLEGEKLYRRFQSELNFSIELRVIDRSLDLDIFHYWHNQERVSYFWELNKSKSELKEYITKALNDAHLVPIIATINNEPVGYFEIYWTPEDRLGPIYQNDPYDRGFHLLIGNQNYLGFKNTDAMLKAVTHYIFIDSYPTKKIMGEPRADNEKILKYVDTFPAWRRVKIFDFPHKRAWLLECDREKFFKGNYL